MNQEKFVAMTRVLMGQEIKKNYLAMLQMLEEICEKHDIDKEEFQYYRKIILDYGNDTKRKVESHLDRVKLSLKVK